MNQLATLLKGHYEHSTYKSIAALARAAQEHTALSESYLKHLLRGDRDNPSYDKLIAIARALDLGRADTNRLLEAAGLPPMAPEENVADDPQAQRILDAFAQLRQTPGLPDKALRAVVNGFMLLVEGARSTADATVHGGPSTRLNFVEPLRTNTDARAQEGWGVESPQQTRELRGGSGTQDKAGLGVSLQLLPPSVSLGPEESLVDDLLGEILSRSGDHPMDTLFLFLEEAAGEKGWEIKWRIAEALPQLVELQPEATLRLAALLREDYHSDYRADIRRRVVEAVPSLYRYGPKESLELLTFREKDDIFTAIAIAETLHNLESAGLITAIASDRYLNMLRPENAVEEEVVKYLRRLLHEARETPAAALMTMRGVRDHEERLFKICALRTAPRLLESHPQQTLEFMAYFLRRGDDGEPAEHKNARRPVVKALPEITALTVDGPSKLREQASQLLQALAQDPDIHIRRAVGDSLTHLVAVSPKLVMGTLDLLVRDPDPYVRQRAGRAVLKLADLYPEQARDYYVALLSAVV